MESTTGSFCLSAIQDDSAPLELIQFTLELFRGFLINCEIDKISLREVLLGDKHVRSLLELHNSNKVIDVRLDGEIPQLIAVTFSDWNMV